MHTKPHRQRGQVVPVVVRGERFDFEVEDWWNRVSPRFANESDEMVYGRDLSGRPALSRVISNAELQAGG